MAIVITDGKYYIKYSETGAIKKTVDINEAHQFLSVAEAIASMKKAEAKTKNYMVFNTFSGHVIWKWMTQEERKEARENKIQWGKIEKVKRKTYSQDVRKLIYSHAGGRCELCGRNLLFEDMTLDHIKPLSVGGEDDVTNLACTCYVCNQFKGNSLPDTLFERVSLIYQYQMEKKHGNSLKWKMAHWIIKQI